MSSESCGQVVSVRKTCHGRQTERGREGAGVRGAHAIAAAADSLSRIHLLLAVRDPPVRGLLLHAVNRVLALLERLLARTVGRLAQLVAAPLHLAQRLLALLHNAAVAQCRLALLDDAALAAELALDLLLDVLQHALEAAVGLTAGRLRLTPCRCGRECAPCDDRQARGAAMARRRAEDVARGASLRALVCGEGAPPAAAAAGDGGEEARRGGAPEVRHEERHAKDAERTKMRWAGEKRRRGGERGVGRPHAQGPARRWRLAAQRRRFCRTAESRPQHPASPLPAAGAVAHDERQIRI